MVYRKITLLAALLVFNLMLAQNQTSCKCCSDNHRAFDFWIGDWTVANAKDGSPAGTSKISQVEGGCVIRENWTSAKSGFTGTSLNFYNATDKQWEQLWLDNTGAYLKLKGKRDGNQMILSSDPVAKDDGTTYVNRITWTTNEDGTVRQLWEILQGGEVVNTAFDGIYSKTK
ncbi:hypothetical protein [Flagellimonas flava]|uniref:Uncharacterized protein n=1 Tax=Flagellimonas flava TaxID=570519 RepID=A0A1M5HLK6_9FLAO|nr:hypothetical protein [Allomuricauda flava]SHG16801.1 hypothetical protein SAMN04488116_0053 [Allomuricauda flava]